MFYRLSAILLSALLLLPGCKSEKLALTGKRENILLGDPDLKSDPALAKQKIVLDAPTLNRNWQQPSALSTHCLHVALTQNKLSETWKASIGPASSGIRRLVSPPVVHEGVVYTLNADGYVVANRTSDGKTLWKISICPQGEARGGLGGGSAYHQEKLYVSTPYAEVVAIDTQQKQVVWRKDISTPARSAPTIYQNRLFLLTLNNTLVCLDTVTGKELWMHHGMLENAGLLGGANAAVSAGIAVVPYTSGEVYGLRAETGETLWTESLASFGRVDSISSLPHIHARPVIRNNAVYVVSHSGRSAALRLETGDMIWEKEFGGSETPAVSGNTAFILTSAQVLLAIDKETGKVRWTKALEAFKEPEQAKGFIVWKGPVLAGGKLILTSSHAHMLLLDAYTGNVIQDIELPHESSIEPIVVQETVYVLTDTGHLVAYR